MQFGRVSRIPAIARLIIDGPALCDFLDERESLGAAELILATVLKKWAGNPAVDFFVTPGGFIHGRLPSGLSGKRGWESKHGDFSGLVRAAERLVDRVVTLRVSKHAKGKCRYLTMGIDLESDDGTAAELVALIDVAEMQVLRWTGKSYPTSAQERSLIQVVDLASHLVRLEGQRILLLGCHDLNMFSPRSWANQSPWSPRRKRCREMRELVATFDPTVVLQHAHETDSPRIWRMPWLSLVRRSDIRTWASGICFYNGGSKERASLSSVLSGTRSEEAVILDFIVRTRRRTVQFASDSKATYR